ncbi:MAG: glycosyltransferase family 39 protein [Clostridiales bacterium]|nr:glycosyltransferase family 39 protein [Clostridiales bacterium]
MKKITAYTWAFILVLLSFFTVGMFTLGCVKTTGKSMTVLKDTAVYYNLESSQSLKAVYVNVGGIHTALGEDATITVKTTNSTTSSPSYSTMGSSFKLGNVVGKEGTNGGLYNWVAITTGQSRTALSLSFTSNVPLQLNEIVAINKNNEIVTLEASTYGGNYTVADVRNTIDAQENFARFIGEDGTVTLENGAFNNFTQEEGYYMSSVQNLLSGNEKYDANYVLDGNFNYFATVLMTPAVAIFGNSVFALRLPAFISTCLMIVFAYFLIKELTKREQLAFYFSLILMVGGLATTVGRLGAPYAMIACAIVASAYYMYRFFAYGISSKDMLRGASSILISGLFGAAAIAMDLTALLPIAGVLALYVFGLRRQKMAHELALSKTAEFAEKVVTEEGETVVVNKMADKENETFATKTRLSYGFAALSFGMGTFVFLLLASILCYSSYVRALNNESVSFLAVLWNGLKASVCDNGVTAYTAANTSIWAWLLPIKPTALYTANADGGYTSWLALPNVAVLCASAVAFVISTVKVLVDLINKKSDRQTLRMRRTYCVLFGGMLLAFFAGLIRGNASALSGMLFHVLYLGFLPLVGMLIPEGESLQEKVLVNVALCTVVAAFALIFALSLPVMYGYTVAASRVNLFKWMTLFSNGFFKI